MPTATHTEKLTVPGLIEGPDGEPVGEDNTGCVHPYQGRDGWLAFKDPYGTRLWPEPRPEMERPLELYDRAEIPIEAMRRALETGESQSVELRDWEFSVTYSDSAGTPVLTVRSSTMETLRSVPLESLSLEDIGTVYVEFFGGNHEVWELTHNGWSFWEGLWAIGGTIVCVGSVSAAAAPPISGWAIASATVSCGGTAAHIQNESEEVGTHARQITDRPWEN